MKPIFSNLLNVHYIKWQGGYLLIKAATTNIIKASWHKVFLSSGLRKLFRQSDQVIFLVRKVML